MMFGLFNVPAIRLITDYVKLIFFQNTSKSKE